MSGEIPPTGLDYYIYKPAHGVSIAFAVLFGISGIAHIWQNNLKYKSYRIGFLLPWAALIFCAGFILREYGSYHTDNLNIFIASTVLLFVAPPVYNGANYFVAGRAMYYLPYLTPIHPGRVWTTFITLDTLAAVVAANGASRAASDSEDQRKVGLILVKVSLFMLIGMFLGFMSLTVVFHYRAVNMGVLNHKLKTILHLLYASNLLILLRNCFRTAAYFCSWDSTSNSQEWPVWIFEFVPMLVNSYMMNICPPAKYLPANHKIYLAVDGETEIEGPGMIDKRSFLASLIDPFDIRGVITKKDQKNRYWLQDGIGGPRPDGQTFAPGASDGPRKV